MLSMTAYEPGEHIGSPLQANDEVHPAGLEESVTSDILSGVIEYQGL